VKDSAAEVENNNTVVVAVAGEEADTAVAGEEADTAVAEEEADTAVAEEEADTAVAEEKADTELNLVVDSYCSSYADRK
jgi:hypothetical protein